MPTDPTPGPLSCRDFPGARCCNSCHEDWDLGYDQALEIEYEGRTAFVCCGVLHWLDEQEQATP